MRVLSEDHERIDEGELVVNKHALVEEQIVENLCSFCKQPMDKPQRCGKCKKARYCNQICQKKHWATHKVYCKPTE